MIKTIAVERPATKKTSKLADKICNFLVKKEAVERLQRVAGRPAAQLHLAHNTKVRLTSYYLFILVININISGNC